MTTDETCTVKYFKLLKRQWLILGVSSDSGEEREITRRTLFTTRVQLLKIKTLI